MAIPTERIPNCDVNRLLLCQTCVCACLYRVFLFCIYTKESQTHSLYSTFDFCWFVVHWVVPLSLEFIFVNDDRVALSIWLLCSGHECKLTVYVCCLRTTINKRWMETALETIAIHHFYERSEFTYSKTRWQFLTVTAFVNSERRRRGRGREICVLRFISIPHSDWIERMPTTAHGADALRIELFNCYCVYV